LNAVLVLAESVGVVQEGESVSGTGETISSFGNLAGVGQVAVHSVQISARGISVELENDGVFQIDEVVLAVDSLRDNFASGVELEAIGGLCSRGSVHSATRAVRVVVLVGRHSDGGSRRALLRVRREVVVVDVARGESSRGSVGKHRLGDATARCVVDVVLVVDKELSRRCSD